MVQDIADYIGHEDINTTQKYIRNNSAYILGKVDDCFVSEKSLKTELKLGKRKIKLGLTISEK